MATQVLETITTYTGLSPTTLLTAVAIVARLEDLDLEGVTLFVDCYVKADELKEYDGTDPKKPLLMAIKGQIYDVSQSRMFYGPGGPYALFAGKDASRALAKMSFEEKDLTGDITGLGLFELDALRDWEYKFMSKYAKVGTIKTPETAPEPSTACSGC
nr:membrane steroid-binding protein 2-like [Tanacetum cinerariifolium]